MENKNNLQHTSPVIPAYRKKQTQRPVSTHKYIRPKSSAAGRNLFPPLVERSWDKENRHTAQKFTSTENGVSRRENRPKTANESIQGRNQLNNQSQRRPVSRQQQLQQKYAGERRESRRQDDRTELSLQRSEPSFQPDGLAITYPGDLYVRERKPPEPTEEERVLADKSKTRHVMLQERKRREVFQKKVEAASLIQRAWRRHRKSKGVKQRRNVMEEHMKDSIHKKRLRATQEEWERQIAALTIQLAWRKFFRKKLLRALHPNRRQLLMWDPEIVALKQQALVNYIYNEQLQAPFWHPTLRPAIRPLWTRFIPSPAAVSYNFAVDQYVPFVARAGAIPEYPAGFDPEMTLGIMPLESSRTGSVEGAGKRPETRGTNRSRSGSDKGSDSSRHQTKPASGGKTKSARASQNMRRKL